MCQSVTKYQHLQKSTLKDSPGAKGKKDRVFSACPHFPARRAFRWTALSIKLTFNWSPTSPSVSSSWGALDRITSMLVKSKINPCLIKGFPNSEINLLWMWTFWFILQPYILPIWRSVCFSVFLLRKSTLHLFYFWRTQTCEHCNSHFCEGEK